MVYEAVEHVLQSMAALADRRWPRGLPGLLLRLWATVAPCRPNLGADTLLYLAEVAVSAYAESGFRDDKALRMADGLLARYRLQQSSGSGVCLASTAVRVSLMIRHRPFRKPSTADSESLYPSPAPVQPSVKHHCLVLWLTPPPSPHSSWSGNVFNRVILAKVPPAPARSAP